jgi:hypothetical protein
VPENRQPSQYDALDILCEAMHTCLVENSGHCLTMENKACPVCILNRAIKHLTEQEIKHPFTPEEENEFRRIAAGE